MRIKTTNRLRFPKNAIVSQLSPSFPRAPAGSVRAGGGEDAADRRNLSI